ncbi:MAG: hypothetical protein EAX95_15490 [Candidatus Thorarchaeota archaeon]|nr:hypothetical protein [Candidatus Thorarchaeota archaeon]
MQTMNLQTIILGNFLELAVLCILLWFAIHVLYKKGYFGPWPPTNRLARIAIWVFLLFPFIFGLGISSVVLLIVLVIPSVEPEMVIIYSLFESAVLVFIILFIALLYFRVLTWCWKGYGAAGVIVIMSATFSAGLTLSSLGLLAIAADDVLGMARMAWAGGFIFMFCWLREELKPKTEERPTTRNVLGHTPIEVGMERLYGIILPLIRRLRVDRDEESLHLLKGMLQLNEGFERSISLACRALGFNKETILEATNADDALETLKNVDTRWGNVSLLDLGVLFAISIPWVVSLILSVLAYADGVLRQYPLLFILDITLPLGIIILLFLFASPRLGGGQDIAKRHDEVFKFTRDEFQRRRGIDLLTITASLIGTTTVTLMVVVLFSDFMLLIPLSGVYVFSLLLVMFDDLVRGKRPSHELMLTLIRRRLPDEVRNTGNASD